MATKINITNNAFISLKKLLLEGYILKSNFKFTNLLKALLECNAVYVKDRPAVVYLNDSATLLGVIRANGYEVNSSEDIDYFISQYKDIKSRDEISRNYSNTKRVESKSFNGLMVSVLKKLEVEIGDKKQYLYPMNGCGTFIHYTLKFNIDNETIVVGVENPQVVWYIQKYKHLFEEEKKYIFLSISEYKTTYQYEWLESFYGEYIHFGDFDLAGVNIYLKTIVPRLKNAKAVSFLIPKNIYKLMKEKKYKKDYSRQMRYFNIHSDKDENLQTLINFIKNNKITLEQEHLGSNIF